MADRDQANVGASQNQPGGTTTQANVGASQNQFDTAGEWSHDFNGVANADIDSIMGVALADIDSVNGV